jgi:hypothetical protein
MARIRSIPYWITSVFYFLPWLIWSWFTGRGHFFSFRFSLVSTPQLNTQLLKFLRLNSNISYHALQFLSYSVCIHCHGNSNMSSDLLPSNRSPTVDCVTSRICLRKRCLAMDYSVTIRSPYLYMITEGAYCRPWIYSFFCMDRWYYSDKTKHFCI